MAALAMDAETCEYISGIYRAALSSPDILLKMQGSGVTLQVTYTDPDAILTIHFPRRKIYEDATEAKLDVKLLMTADNIKLSFLGKLNLPAMTKG